MESEFRRQKTGVSRPNDSKTRRRYDAKTQGECGKQNLGLGVRSGHKTHDSGVLNQITEP